MMKWVIFDSRKACVGGQNLSLRINQESIQSITEYLANRSFISQKSAKYLSRQANAVGMLYNYGRLGRLLGLG